MADWTPEDDDPTGDTGDTGDEEIVVVRVMTASPIALRLVPTTHPRQPEGHTVFRALGALEGAVSDESPVLAQGSLPTAMYDAIEAEGILRDPAPLLLTAQEDDGGVRATIAALVSAERLERADRARRSVEEPWRVSLGPTADEVLASAGADDEEEAEPQVVPLLLGLVLRFPEDRRHPDSLEQEAIDLLGTLLSGGAMDADRKRVENLLRSL